MEYGEYLLHHLYKALVLITATLALPAVFLHFFPFSPKMFGSFKNNLYLCRRFES